jgi:ribonuclease P protein component
VSATLPKTERLSGTKAVSELFGRGKAGVCGCLRYKYLHRADGAPSRIVVSVPKRSFKRAVKRNLLKRRIREAYRRQKDLLGPGFDVVFIYILPSLATYDEVFADMTAVLQKISRELQGAEGEVFTGIDGDDNLTVKSDK